MGQVLSAVRFKSALDAASTIGTSIRDRGCGIECGSDRNSFVSLLVKSVERFPWLGSISGLLSLCLLIPVSPFPHFCLVLPLT